MPASRQRRRSSAKALAVMAIIGNGAERFLFFRANPLVASIPSIAGIRMSIATRSKVCCDIVQGHGAVIGHRHQVAHFQDAAKKVFRSTTLSSASRIRKEAARENFGTFSRRSISLTRPRAVRSSPNSASSSEARRSGFRIVVIPISWQSRLSLIACSGHRALSG